MNSVAGGGTLLTFPALTLVLGPSAAATVMANATSTVALWPGSFASLMGYRRELVGVERWATRLAVPSLLGGLVGAALLLITPEERFRALVPWLVFGATLLFATGRYLDRIRLGETPVFEDKLVLLDSRRVDTLLAIPL